MRAESKLGRFVHAQTGAVLIKYGPLEGRATGAVMLKLEIDDSIAGFVSAGSATLTKARCEAARAVLSWRGSAGGREWLLNDVIRRNKEISGADQNAKKR